MMPVSLREPYLDSQTPLHLLKLIAPPLLEASHSPRLSRDAWQQIPSWNRRWRFGLVVLMHVFR